MLRITPEAGLAIQRLTAAQGAAVDGGLRIDTVDQAAAAKREPTEFTVSVEAVSDERDLVVTEELTGARVLLDPVTSEILDDQTLDVDDTVEGQARFRVLPNTPE